MGLELVPLTQAEAKSFVERHHRHHQAPLGSIFQVGVASVGEVVGVAIVGRPVARMAQDGYTVEVLRCCTDGTRNACSMLYRTCWKAARSLGYRKLITYTLPEEGGASLRAAGMRCVGQAGGGSWHREGRPRIDLHPTQLKLRWEFEEAA